jgi:hypothetical protein
MDIRQKLKLLKEGYTIEEIDSYIEEIVVNCMGLNESALETVTKGARSILEHIKRFFEWIRQKFMQFMNFLRTKFKKTFNEKSLKSRISRIKNPSDTNKEYEFEIRSKIHSVDEDFLKNGVEKVFKAIEEQLLNVLNDNEGNSKISSFGEAIIHDENKFINYIFNSALKIGYNEKEIVGKIYGDFIKIKVSYDDLDELVNKVNYMQDKQIEMLEFINFSVPAKLREYKMGIDERIELLIHDQEEKKKSGDYKAANEIQKEIDGYKDKLQKFISLFNHMMKMLTKMVNIHKKITDELSDSISSIITKMEEDIRAK